MSASATGDANEAIQKPFHLQGNFAPVTDEVTGFDLEVVEGAIPPELNGIYIRNSANPVSGSSNHWFMGDGMLHGVRLEAGRAAWYRNRYVRTPYLQNPDIARMSADGRTDRSVSKANTSVIRHAGQILALEEGSFPYIVTGELETVGFNDYEGKLDTAMSAHAKICPVSGELLFFGYSPFPPYLTYHRVSRDGKLVQSEVINVAGPTMMHDFAVTEHYALFLDLPVIFDMQLASQGQMPFHWSDDYQARIGIMPRTGNNNDVKWFDVEPCYIFHGLNAYEDGDSVVFDASRSSEMWRQAGSMSGGGGRLTLHQFRFDLNTGSVTEQTLDERPLEFPRVAESMVGQKHRYGFTLHLGSASDGSPDLTGLVKVDLDRGSSESHGFGEFGKPSEPTFVQAAGSDARSDEGYVFSYVHDESRRQTQLVILDATRIADNPVARIALPQRVPYGFHGNWMPDAA